MIEGAASASEEVLGEDGLARPLSEDIAIGGDTDVRAAPDFDVDLDPIAEDGALAEAATAVTSADEIAEIERAAAESEDDPHP